MKKRIVVGLFLVIFLMWEHVSAENNVVLKVGFNTSGKLTYSIPGYGADVIEVEQDVAMGPSLSAEYVVSFIDIFYSGFGISYQLPRSIEDSRSDINFIPIYYLARLHLSKGDVSPYLTTQIGWNFYNIESGYSDSDDHGGGIYYGIGVGFTLNKMFQLELLFATHMASIDGNDIKYKNTALSMGINF